MTGSVSQPATPRRRVWLLVLVGVLLGIAVLPGPSRCSDDARATVRVPAGAAAPLAAGAFETSQTVGAVTVEGCCARGVAVRPDAVASRGHLSADAAETGARCVPTACAGVDVSSDTLPACPAVP
jgi:hypothetical protein